jgi:hypothetical protein
MFSNKYHTNAEQWLVIVLNATFNNISVISWLSVLLGYETGKTKENKPAASH